MCVCVGGGGSDHVLAIGLVEHAHVLAHLVIMGLVEALFARPVPFRVAHLGTVRV
jgi:hypothetical protein